MGRLNEAGYQKFVAILEGLEPVIARLNPSSRNFVQDQIKRNDQYAEGTFISPKQMQWLENLYTEHVGSLFELPVEDDTTSRDYDDPDDMDEIVDDDEIPF